MAPTGRLSSRVPRALALVLAVFPLALACDPGVRLGNACTYTSECPAGLVCGFGRCRAECRENVDCPLGALCRVSGGLPREPAIGSCELPDDPRCPATPCPDGSLCLEGRCVDECASDADCALGNVCAASELGAAVCVDPRTAPDAAIDAGPTDGGRPPDAGDGQCHGPRCEPIVAIAMEGEHACALASDGSVWCWGLDATGQSSGIATGEPAPSCAEGALRCRPTPVEIALAGPAAEVGAGLGFSCARLRDGRAQCWGSNAVGSLGRPISIAPEPAPFVVVEESGRQIEAASRLALGRCHALAARGDGLWGWGCNAHGQLADTAPDRASATPVGVDRRVPDELAAGGFFSCARHGVEVWCWGSNAHGQLGRGSAGGTSEAPQRVDPLGDAIALALGAEHACALVGGDAWCWGDDPLVDTDVLAPTRIVTLDGASFATLASSPTSHVTCGVTAARDEIRCWGVVSTGTFFPDGATAHGQPVAIATGGPFAEAAVDGSTGCALTDRGDLLCWGENTAGTLGLGHDMPGTSALRRVLWPE